MKYSIFKLLSLCVTLLLSNSQLRRQSFLAVQISQIILKQGCWSFEDLLRDINLPKMSLLHFHFSLHSIFHP